MNDIPEAPILVTGATGFLGSHVCEELVGAGFQVRGLVRDAARAPFLREAGVELVEGDVTSPATLPAAVEGCHAVVNCVARVAWGARDEMFRVNVDGLRALLDASVAARVERVVEVSSVGVYGARDHDGTTEDAPLEHSGDAYVESKIAAEELVRERSRSDGLPFVILRPGPIFGPRDRHLTPKLVANLRNGRYAYVDGGGNQQALVYVGNVARAVPAALTRAAALGEAFTITEPVRRTTRDVVETVVDILDLPAPTKSFPRALAWAYCSLSETVARLRGSDEAPIVNRASLRFNSLSRHFDVSKARELLDYAPDTDLETNLRRTLASELEAQEPGAA